MGRLRGRAPRSTRCRATVPHGHWKTTTLVAAPRLQGMTAPMVVDGAINGEGFRARVRHMFAPSLGYALALALQDVNLSQLG